MALEASLAINDEKLVVESIARIAHLMEPLLAMSQPTPFALQILVAADSAMKAFLTPHPRSNPPLTLPELSSNPPPTLNL